MKLFRNLFVALLVATTGVAQAEEALSEHNPFAEQHVILQVSSDAPERHSLVLDISNNLPKFYGQDLIDLQIVAFGPGVAMLLAESGNEARIASLFEHGVRFYACGNTLDTIERKTGKRPVLLPGVSVVQTGVAYIVDEVNRGYTLVKP